MLDIYDEIKRLGFTNEEEVTLYAFFISNSDKKDETEKNFTCLQDKEKIDLLKKLITSCMFSHLLSVLLFNHIIPNTYMFLCFSFCFLLANLHKKHFHVIVGQLLLIILSYYRTESYSFISIIQYLQQNQLMLQQVKLKNYLMIILMT
jgi:hypothetical protein